MEDTLPHFHRFKDVVLLRRAGNEAKAKANALRMELMEKRKVGKKTYVKTWTPSRKWCEMNAWRDDLSRKIDVSEKFDGDFILPKIHLVSHWVQQIPWYAALQQYSAERHEQAHKTNLKDSWNASNHNLNYLP